MGKDVYLDSQTINILKDYGCDDDGFGCNDAIKQMKQELDDLKYNRGYYTSA